MQANVREGGRRIQRGEAERQPLIYNTSPFFFRITTY